MWIGRVLNHREATLAIDEEVTAVIDLTVNFSEAKPLHEVRYLQVPVLDLTAPTAAQFDEAIVFIEAELLHGVVLVRCKIGYSRSAAIVGACLIASGIAADADDAIRRLQEVRPSIVIRPEAEDVIREYESRAR